jgi:hypothetical protein
MVASTIDSPSGGTLIGIMPWSALEAGGRMHYEAPTGAGE